MKDSEREWRIKNRERYLFLKRTNAQKQRAKSKVEVKIFTNSPMSEAEFYKDPHTGERINKGHDYATYLKIERERNPKETLEEIIKRKLAPKG